MILLSTSKIVGFGATKTHGRFISYHCIPKKSLLGVHFCSAYSGLYFFDCQQCMISGGNNQFFLVLCGWDGSYKHSFNRTVLGHSKVQLTSPGGDINWPPRFSDLAPLVFLRDYVKYLVYADKPQTNPLLRSNITCAIWEIESLLCENVIENVI